MWKAGKPARVNVKLLLILLLGAVALAVAVGAGHYLRKRAAAAKALSRGLAAYEQRDWPNASKHLRRYLTQHSTDVQILYKYAHACMSVQPLQSNHIKGAIDAYRQLLNVDPNSQTPYRKLALLYLGTGNYTELAYIAERKLQRDPHDPQASIWLAQALFFQNRLKPAKETLQDLLAKLARQDGSDEQYVDACVLLARIELQRQADDAYTEALAWLNRAVDRDPRSAKALVNRAWLYQKYAAGADREPLLAAAQADLARAEQLTPADPRVYLILTAEWMKSGRFDRCREILHTTDQVPPDQVRRYFLDPTDWRIARFLLAGELALRQGSSLQAAALADEFLPTLKSKPKRLLVLPTAVRLYVAANRVKQARVALDEYLNTLRASQSTAPFDERIAMLKATVAAAEQKPYQIIELLEPIVAPGPRDAAAWKLLGKAYHQTGQTRRAIRALEQFTRRDGNDKEAYRLLSRLHFVEGHWSKAIAAARAAETNDSEDITLKLMSLEAAIHLAHRRGDAAELQALQQELAGLQQAHPELVQVRLVQALLAALQEQHAEAEAILKQAVDQCDNPLPAYLQLAQLYRDNKQPDKALRTCQAACQAYPQWPSPWLTLAELLQADGRVQEAQATLRKGLEHVQSPPARRQLNLKLALMQIFTGQRQEGIDLLKTLARQDGSDIDVRQLLLKLPEIRRRPALAKELIDQIRAVEGPAGLRWRLQQAALWLDHADWRSRRTLIAEHLQRCIDGDPSWPAPVLVLGRMYQRLGQVSKAETLYRQLLLRNPAAAMVADRLLTLLERQKRYADAEEVLKHLNVSPRRLSAYRLRAALGAGDLTQAIEELKLIIASDADDVHSYALLARLIYRQTHNAELAFRYLDRAAAITGETTAIIAARVAILKAEGHLDQARDLLDQFVARDGSFDAYHLRAAYLASVQQFDQAQEDYTRLTRFPDRPEAYELLGKFHVDREQLDAAVETFEKGLQRYPKSQSLTRRLLKVLYLRNKQDDRRRSAALLEQLQKQLPHDPDLLWVQALLLLARDDKAATDQAERILQRVVELDPTILAAHLALIDLAFGRGDFALARDRAIRSLATHPDSAALLLARAKAERALNNTHLARELARMVLSEDPENAHARNLLVELALASADPEALADAEKSVQRALGRNPDNARLQVANAMVLAALGKTDLAIESLQAFVKSKAGSTSAEAALHLARLYRREGDFDQAENYLQLARELAPDSTGVLSEQFVLLGARRQYDRVNALIQQYIATNPDQPGPILTAGSVLAAANQPKRLQQARDLFLYVTQTWPKSIAAQLKLAMAEYYTGRVDRAEQIYRSVLKAQPDNVQALNDLAWILAQARRQYRQALELANRGVALDPRNVHLRDTRATILAQLPGRQHEALLDYEQCVQLSPPGSAERAGALLKLARFYAGLARTNGARQCLLQALQIDQRRHVLTAEQRREINALLASTSQPAPTD